MENIRKFSIFISSTYEDLKEERQALVGVALENNFIPVGMEQFHAAPISQWNVITKMIDECDFYLFVIGGRYGSIDGETGLLQIAHHVGWHPENTGDLIDLELPRLQKLRLFRGDADGRVFHTFL